MGAAEAANIAASCYPQGAVQRGAGERYSELAGRQMSGYY